MFLTRDWFAERPYLQPALTPTDIVLDHTVTTIHLAFADEEMKAATRERDTWCAAWRQRDFDFFTSQEFRNLLHGQNIKLVTWRELARAAAK